jgi:preprotein translocase subunit SecA
MAEGRLWQRIEGPGGLWQSCSEPQHRIQLLCVTKVIAHSTITEPRRDAISVCDAATPGVTRPADAGAGKWDLDALWAALTTLYPIGLQRISLTQWHRRQGRPTRTELLAVLLADAERALAQRQADLTELAGDGAMRHLERSMLLDVIDRRWREHLYEMDYLKAGIGLRALAQRDPVVEYQREGYDMFVAMVDGIKEDFLTALFSATMPPVPAERATPASAAARVASHEVPPTAGMQEGPDAVVAAGRMHHSG